MMWLVGLIIIGMLIVVPWWALATALRHERELKRLRERVDDLERRAIEPSVVPLPDEIAATPLPEPIPLPLPPAVAHPGEAPGIEPVVVPAGRRAQERSGIEQLVGGIWLQNAGAVLLLLGVFFLILWGYTTGRLGPIVLVVAGVVLGLIFAWRGSRIARTTRAFGHAVIGIGLGIAYLSLYLGHFTLRALPAPIAFSALTALSLASVLVGLRHRSQTVAALGVIGAFLPQCFAAWISLRGFSLTPEGLLGYFALVDLVVFALAARAGWSGLNLMALGLTAFTWIATFPRLQWGWGIEIGLCALFVLLGLAPIRRFAARQGRVGNLELAVVAMAPLCLVAASWPFLAYVHRTQAAILLLVLATLYLLASLWIDARRPERDLWRPLTGAATLFLTAALQRAVGNENTPMAWCVEGALLIALGLSPRAGWLRFSGYVVSSLGALWLADAFVSGGRWNRDLVPVVHPDGVRNLVCLATLVVIAALLAHRRDRLEPAERLMPEAVALVANLLIVFWGARESANLARWLIEDRGPSSLPPPHGRAGATAQGTLGAVFTSAAATIQAGVLLTIGWLRDSPFLRWMGLGLFGFTVLKFLLFDLQQADTFWRFLTAIAVGAVLLVVSYLYQRRARERAEG